MSPQIENSSSSEDANIEGFESGLQYNASSVNTNVISLNKIDECYVKELGIIKSKENKKDRSKKKVSFDMNVSEIILKSEEFQIDGENSQNSAFKSNAECKASDCSQDTVDVNIKHDIGDNLPINSHIAPKTTDKDMVLEDPHMSVKSNQIDHIPKPGEDEICDISVYNMRIMDSLNSFRARPLTQMQSTKCLVITIPLEEDMPKAKIRDHQKKTLSLKSTKKPNNQRTLKDFSKNESKSLRNMLPSVRNKLETLRNPAQLSDARVCEIKRNNNTQSSEQNESDMEDSFILDRELSDLAKVCLDSDSTVGGDDDSVLNFGIAASDDSSVDNEFYSKELPINQTKLSSPLNIKKRFTRKLKSLGIDVNIQKLKSATASNMKKLQNYANDENVLKSQEKLSINEQEKRKSKRGRKQDQDTSNMQITLIDNRRGSTEVSKGNIEESVISKEVLTSCEISGFESLKVKNTELDTVTQGSSCKLHEKDLFKGEIAHLKSNIIINSTEERTMCNKTEPSLTITCNEDVADDMSRIEMAEGSSIPLQPQISDIDDESKDSISPLRRVRKKKINDKDAIFSNEHNSSFHEKCEGKTSLNCNSSNDGTNLPEISFTRKNPMVKNDENPNDIDCINDIEKGKIVEELEFEGKKNFNANKSMLIEINVEEESLKHRMQKRKLTEVSDCYDPGSSEVIAIDDVCKTKKEKLLRKKNYLIDIDHTLELNCSSKKGTNNLGEEHRKSKHIVTGLLHKSENLRQTRSKSQRRSEKVDIVENSNTPIIPLDTVEIEKKCLKQTRSDNLFEEKIDGNNTFSTENIVKLDSNKTKDNIIICKKAQPISRTVSTESFDEPLITLKNKLLAGENEEKFHKDTTVCNFVEESKLILKQNNNLMNSEECKNKVETSTTVSSNSTGQYNSINSSQIEKIKEEEIKTVPNLEFLPTNVSNSDKSYPDSLRTSSEDSILSIETSTNKSFISNSHGNDVEYSVSPDLNLSVFKCNIAGNPEVKGTLRKKRDKSEVDAEIKRRLAEIDELEKIATTQHATVLEKIGARTRSKTVLKLAKSTDDVQACCEDSQEKKREIQKPISSITGDATKKALLSNSVETSNTLDKTVIKSIEKKSCENDSMSPDSNEDQVCDKLNKELTCSTSVTARKKGKQVEKTKLCENIAEESRTLSKDLLTSPGEQTRRTRRNVASAYKLRDKNDDAESLVCTKIPNCNRSIGKQSIDVYEETNKTPFLSISENSVSLGSIRKTRNKSSMYEAHSVKSSESSRESSPSNQVGTILSEYSPKYVTSESKLNKTALSSTITEPDSSTPTVDSHIGPVSPSMHKCIPGTMKRKNENGTKYISPVESTLSDMSLEPDTVESSAMAMNVFRHPLRKTVLNRNRRRRRAFEETRFSALSHSTPRASETDSLHGCNDQDKCLSEGIVSSSVNTIPTCDLKKKRRKRKSFVDLLMDDSMLSVTRDFPMSPNPYILPSFDKELEISSNKTQLTNLYDSDKTINELADTNSLPPRPDILAQKLRILEKLKNINRKNRKTRQCRTLVCYNEDSLPESLVESPASEGVPQNSDSEMSSQDLTLTKDDEKEQSSLIQISESVKEDMTNNSCKKKVKANPKLFVLRKRGRKSASFSNQFPKAKKNNIDDSSDIKTLKGGKGLKRHFEEDTSNSDESSSYDMDENYSKSSLNMAVETNNTTINSNQTSDKQKICSNMEEPSEFDKLLQSSSNKAKLNFNFDHNLRLSPMEGKSYHSSIDFFETYTSRENKNDTKENDINCGKNLSELPKNFQPNSVKEVFCSMSNTKLFQERILCSILKVKIGKMLPLFGDSSSSEEDLDEDIPLFVKLSQTYQNRLSTSEKTKNTTIDKSINIATKEESLVQKKRGRKPKVSVPTSSPNRYEDKLKLGGFEVFSDVKNKSVSIKENKELDKVFDYCDESTVSNPESRPLLRKSNRRPRSLQAPNEEKSINNLEGLNIVEASLNETASNMPLCFETSQNEIDKSNYLEKQIIPVRKRGRPRKIKHPDQKYDSDLIPKEDSQKDKLEVEISVLQYETKPYNTIKEDCLNTQTSRIKEQLSYSPDENLIASQKDGEIGRLESTLKDPKFSQNLPSDNEDSGQLIEDSVIKNQETLPKTRAKHAKFTQNKQDLGDEIINNLDNAVSFTDLEKTSVDTKSAAVEGQIVKRRWQRGKWPRRQQSTMIHSINNVGDCDAVEDSKASDIEDVESLLETPLNDLPPPLVKTRSRRPRNSTLDSLNSDPPLLETPFQLNVDEDKSMDSNNTNSKSAQEMNIVLMNKKRGRKPKKHSDLFKDKNIVNSDSYTDTSPSLNKIAGSSYNYKECDIKTEENYKTAKETDNEKQVCTRKRGRRSKFSVTQKEESDSEIKSSICPITKTKLLRKNEGEEEIVSNSAITDSNSNTNNDNTVTSSFHREANENKTTNSSETIQDKNSFKCCKPKLKRKQINLLSDDQTPHTNEKSSKKFKTKEDDVDVEDSSSPNAPSNIYQDTTSNTSYGYTNQAFLWNKISGFLNKTTRSVGTQVKIKNMALKGFESSEPEVSLQSEMTLPQVIKTLFEELKTTDSSFSDL